MTVSFSNYIFRIKRKIFLVKIGIRRNKFTYLMHVHLFLILPLHHFFLMNNGVYNDFEMLMNLMSEV